MPPITVTYANLGDGSARATPTVSVATRNLWSDSWTARSDLWLNELRWSVSPAIPTASFTFRYGKKLSGSSYADVARLLLPRQFVRVTVTLNSNTMTWYGTLDIHADDIQGSFTSNKASGVLQVTAYGLEKLLADMIIGEHNASASWLDAAPLQCAGCPDFNAGGVPNRNKDKESRPAYVFRKPEVGASPEIVDFWSTADIVDYLLAYYVPQSGAGVQVIPFERESTQWLPDFDKPVVPAEGRTAKGIIDALVNRQRALCWWLEVKSDETKVLFRTATLSPSAVTLDNSGNQLPAASRQIQLVSEADSSATLSMVNDACDTFDRVIVRGAKGTTTLTLRKTTDNTIDAKWTSANQTPYNAGSGTGTTPTEKQQRDAEWRSRPDLRSVYAWFGLPAQWNQLHASGGDPVFVQHDNTAIKYNASPLALRILPVTALEQEADYSTSTSLRTIGKTVAYRPILVALPVVKYTTDPTSVTQRWHDTFTFGLTGTIGIERPTLTSQHQWSARAQVIDTPADHVIELRLQGAPQHCIAKNEFTPAGSHDPTVHAHRWQDFLWTVTVEEDRYCQFAYPITPNPADPLERTMILDAGEGYRLDRLMKNTVLSVNADGTLKKSPSTSYYCRDDRQRLEVMARMAYVWYSRQRRAIRFTTHIFGVQLQLGDMVLSVGDPASAGDDLITTNSTITEITITHGQSMGTRPPPMRFSYATDFGELDPIQAGHAADHRGGVGKSSSVNIAAGVVR